LAILLVHLALHWRWVLGVVGRQLHLPVPSAGRYLPNGLLTLLIVVGLFVLFAWATHKSVRELATPRPHVNQRQELAATSQHEVPDAMPEDSRYGFAAAYRVFERQCLSCHGPERQAGNVRVDRRADLFGRDGREPLVIPGESGESPLLELVAGRRERIPLPSQHRLDPADVEALRAWIDAGAHWPE
jgi:mono/diheme cytochrome c family protein